MRSEDTLRRSVLLVVTVAVFVVWSWPAQTHQEASRPVRAGFVPRPSAPEVSRGAIQFMTAQALAASPPVPVAVPVTVASTTTTTMPPTTTTTRPPPTTTTTAKPPSGRYTMSDLLRRIGGCESNGSPYAPLAWTKWNNSGSGASGAFQDMGSTWRGWEREFGTDGYAFTADAAAAAPAEQIWVNQHALDHGGTGPWSSSESCWRG